MIVFCLSAAAQAKPAILVLGDSLSAGYGLAQGSGWVPLLEQRLARRGYAYDVVNASISGDTTSGGLARLNQALAIHQPAIVILALGGNDGLRGLPVEAMYNNLKAIVTRSRDSGARVVLVGMQIPPNYGPFYTRQFQGLYPRLAEEFDLPLVPFLLQGVAGHTDLFQDDRIHPTAAAQATMLDNVWQVLVPLLGRSS